ncbi:hypothetical protein JCM11251_005858 [Rhodosporidiobolus azoricus]
MFGGANAQRRAPPRPAGAHPSDASSRPSTSNRPVAGPYISKEQKIKGKGKNRVKEEVESGSNKDEDTKSTSKKRSKKPKKGDDSDSDSSSDEPIAKKVARESSSPETEKKEKKGSKDKGKSKEKEKDKVAIRRIGTAKLAQLEVQVDANGDKYIELSSKPQKRATVNTFKGKPLVHIREYYEKDGEMEPGKGIALSVDQFDRLKKAMGTFDDLLDDIS